MSLLIVFAITSIGILNLLAFVAGDTRKVRRHKLDVERRVEIARHNRSPIWCIGCDDCHMPEPPRPGFFAIRPLEEWTWDCKAGLPDWATYRMKRHYITVTLPGDPPRSRAVRPKPLPLRSSR